MNQIVQPLATYRGNPTNHSSQILDVLLDPKLQMFYQALHLGIKEKASSHLYDTNKITEVTLQHDAVDDNETNKLDPNAKVFHPHIDHRKLSISSLPILQTIYTLPPLITNINNPFLPYIIAPNLYNPSCLIMAIPSPPPNLYNPCCSIPVISNESSSELSSESSSVRNKQYEEESNTHFRPKFNNHAKGNFYISRDMISRMIGECIEVFNTDRVNDEKLAFAYFKESVAMQINDGYINHIIMTKIGLTIIINIDLHFKDGEIMYLVANENDPEYREKVRWSITDFMRAHDIYNKYGIPSDELPLSSRNMDYFQNAINMPPINISSEIVKYTNFKNLPKKTSTKKRKSNGIRPHRTEISENDLKYYCFKNWNKSPVIPVVVIKGKKQWIEWKKFIEIYDEYNNNSQSLWIGISMKYDSSNKQWTIECMDYDSGRIYYQYRLVGNTNTKYTISYNQLSKFITTELYIY